MRRLIAGVRWYEAHRSHAYQHAAQRWRSHSKVTLTIAIVNLVWLFPLAWGACVHPTAGPIFMVVAAGPLVYLAFRLHAGQNAPFPVDKFTEIK
jgi:Fuc2NAc and GlcNAc transferase